jgi:hypothetical protein
MCHTLRTLGLSNRPGNGPGGSAVQGSNEEKLGTAHLAQLVEHRFRKAVVVGSIPTVGSDAPPASSLVSRGDSQQPSRWLRHPLVMRREPRGAVR